MLDRDSYWARMLSRRLSRRSALRAGAVAALGAAGLSLARCTDDGEPVPAPTGTVAAGQPRRGGIVTHGRAVDPVDLDPHTSITAMDIFVKVYSNLYFVVPGGETQMNLAESFEIPDDQTFIFTLKEGAKFHDIDPVNGREVTSEDVAYSFKRRGTAIEAIDKRFWKLIQNGMETPDKHTFKVTLDRPFVPAFIEIANPTWTVVPPEAVEEFGNLKQKGIGSGPFMIQRFVRAESVELVRNPDFFLPGRPYLDGHEYVVIPSHDTLLAAFKSGQHDVNGANLDALKVRDLEANPDITVLTTPNFYFPQVGLNMTRAPFDDIRVREAVDLAIDRQELIDKIAFGEGKLNGPIQWGQTSWALSQEELGSLLPYDPERARQLLADAGHEGGFQVTLRTAMVKGFWEDTVTLVAEQLSRVGINVNLQVMDLAAWLVTVLLPGDYDMTFGVNLPYNEPDRPLSFYHSAGVTGSGSPTNIPDPEIDALIEKQQVTFDEVERHRLIEEVQRLVLRRHGPALPLFSNYYHVAFWNRVKGWWPPDQEGTYGNIYNWDIWLDEA